MAPTVLLLGGNEPDTRVLFNRAMELISAEVGSVVARSSLYESPPWGFEADHWFLNRVLVVECSWSPLELLTKTQQIERLLGRKKKTASHYESRSIDIDILFMGEQNLQLSQLQLPHPRLHLRRFTLVPLCELMPEFVHPLLKLTMKELLKSCRDEGIVRKVD